MAEAWSEDTHGGAFRREHMRAWWPALADALDAVSSGGLDPEGATTRERYEAASVVACLVRRYGDRVPTQRGMWSATLSETDLETIDPTALTVLCEPLTGGIYLRVRAPVDADE